MGSVTKYDANKCIICQKKRSRKFALNAATEDGTTKLKTSAVHRKKYGDTKYAAAIVRIQTQLPKFDNEKVWYHRFCYSGFTNITCIKRLKEKHDAATKTSEKAKKIKNSTSSTSVPRTRVSRDALKTDNTKCIICQEDKEEGLRLVQSFNMDGKIKSFKAVNYSLHVRLGCIIDLVAADSLYHSSCILKHDKLLAKSQKELDAGEINTSFIELCRELRLAGVEGKVGHTLRTVIISW